MRNFITLAIMAVLTVIMTGCDTTPATKSIKPKAMPQVGAFDDRGGYTPPAGYSETAIFCTFAQSAACLPIQNTDSEGIVTWTMPPTTAQLFIAPAANNVQITDGRSSKRGGGMSAIFQYWYSGSTSPAVSTDGNISFNVIGTYKVSTTFFSPETSNGLWTKANIVIISQEDWESMTKFDGTVFGYTPYSYLNGTSVPAKYTALATEQNGALIATVGQKLAAKALIVPRNRGGGEIPMSIIEDVQITVCDDFGRETANWEQGDQGIPYSQFSINAPGYHMVQIRIISDFGKKVTTVWKRLHILEAVTNPAMTLKIQVVEANGSLRDVSLYNGKLFVFNNVRFNITANKPAGWEDAIQEIVIFNPIEGQPSPPLMVNNSYIQGLMAGTGTGTVRVMLRRPNDLTDLIKFDFTVEVIDGLGSVR
jgi:hypothetical protein